MAQLRSHELDQNEHKQQHDNDEQEVEQQVETPVVGEIHGEDFRAGVSELDNHRVIARCEARCELAVRRCVAQGWTCSP